MTKEKLCKDCAYCRPEKSILTLWGLLKNRYYYEYATCRRSKIGDAFGWCAGLRKYDWSNPAIPCNKEGKGWIRK